MISGFVRSRKEFIKKKRPVKNLNSDEIISKKNKKTNKRVYDSGFKSNHQRKINPNLVLERIVKENELDIG